MGRWANTIPARLAGDREVLSDIREYFQGRTEQGRMNARSTDAHYTDLIASLRQKLNLLTAKIAPKVYEHGFLKK